MKKMIIIATIGMAYAFSVLSGKFDMRTTTEQEVVSEEVVEVVEPTASPKYVEVYIGYYDQLSDRDREHVDYWTTNPEDDIMNFYRIMIERCETAQE